ncbi:MAG: pyridoxamine 5'-phosphate oxidase family protein [Lachnospiraceae bacterium]|jgi:nitroimidazol reductase NimA-like FMN-containing flavoprotein (pyridoxamine 5'-phosphate oxidase superfamily)|nr:pyridoxamine 5'-phosphate oxidase family protein [Lachnospiraceae bacterium]
MRRKDRELTDMDEIMKIVRRENICCVAFHDEPCPYVVPMNYGAQLEGGRLVLYFHGAAEGTKLELLMKNPHASFTIVSGAKTKLTAEPACKSSEQFESVCGSGRAEIVSPEEKRQGLLVLMNHMGREAGISYDRDAFTENAVDAVAVWKLTAEQVVGKRHE